MASHLANDVRVCYRAGDFRSKEMLDAVRRLLPGGTTALVLRYYYPCLESARRPEGPGE